MAAGKPAAVAPAALDNKTVYWLEDSRKVIAPCIVGRAEFRTVNGPELCFFDTVRPHALRATQTAQPLVFDVPGGGKLTLRPLDRATFDRMFRPRTPGVPAFASDAELQAYYNKVLRAF